jgi:streptogramin lyase
MLQQSTILNKVGLCLILLFIGLMSASVTHAETYSLVTKWGSSGSADGQFNSPIGVDVDFSGNVYVADNCNFRIQKFDSNGTFLTKWGSRGSGDGQFEFPYGIAVDSSGSVYVSDLNNRIQKFDSTGSFVTKWGSLGSDNGQFNGPWGVAVDSSSNVYVADTNNNRIQKFDSSGAFITKWGSEGSGDGQFWYPRGIAVDSSGNVYVDDEYNNRIQKFDSNGMFLTKWGSSGSGEGQFYDTWGVSIDSSGNVYVADVDNNLIQKFDSIGTFITKIEGQFYAPTDIAIDSFGNVYVADFSSQIQKFNTKINPTIIWSIPTGITYGTKLSSTQLNAAATDPITGESVSGDFTYSLADGTPIVSGVTVLSTGQHTLHVDFTPTDTAKYNTASKDININILKATPTVTWSNPADIVHGTALSSTQLNAVASVLGIFTYNSVAGTILPIGAHTLHVDFTPDDAVNYNAASMDVTINVLKATPTITWNNPDDIVQGAALSSTQLNAIASVPGKFVYYPRSGTVLSASIQILHVDFTPADTANYNSASKNVEINVLTPVQKIQQMTATVQGLISSGVLNQKQGDTLISDLNAAIKALNDNQTKKAIRGLNVFISHIEDYVQSGIFTQAQGQDLIDAANSVIYVL